jgi:hypothetical protein
MDLTKIDRQSSIWKDIKTRYVVAAAGVALMASAVVSSAPWQHESGTDASAASITGRSASHTNFERSSTARAAQADIMASVISTELASFIVPPSLEVDADNAREAGAAPLVVNRAAVSDDDLMASVISTELATFSASPASNVASVGMVPDDYQGGFRAPRNLRERLQINRAEFNPSGR